MQKVHEDWQTFSVNHDGPNKAIWSLTLLEQSTIHQGTTVNKLYKDGTGIEI